MSEEVKVDVDLDLIDEKLMKKEDLHIAALLLVESRLRQDVVKTVMQFRTIMDSPDNALAVIIHLINNIIVLLQKMHPELKGDLLADRWVQIVQEDREVALRRNQESEL